MTKWDLLQNKYNKLIQNLILPERIENGTMSINSNGSES